MNYSLVAQWTIQLYDPLHEKNVLTEVQFEHTIIWDMQMPYADILFHGHPELVSLKAFSQNHIHCRNICIVLVTCKYLVGLQIYIQALHYNIAQTYFSSCFSAKRFLILTFGKLTRHSGHCCTFPLQPEQSI